MYSPRDRRHYEIKNIVDMKMKKIIHLCISYSVTKNAIHENVIFEIIGKKMKKDLRYFPWWVPSLKVCGGGGIQRLICPDGISVTLVTIEIYAYMYSAYVQSAHSSFFELRLVGSIPNGNLWPSTVLNYRRKYLSIYYKKKNTLL